MTTTASSTNRTATFKPREVDELIDFYVHRRVASLVVRVLAPTRVTADQVTVSSGATAVVAGVLIGTAPTGRPGQAVIGAVIMFLSMVLDCADGQLARLRGSSSFAGRALDGYVDVVSVVSLFVGQLVWLLANDASVGLTMALALAAGVSFKWHVHKYDHLKNVYLLNTTVPGEDTFPSIEDIERERLEHAAAGRWFSALLCRGYKQFVGTQRRRVKDRAGVDRPAMGTASERDLYRHTHRRFIRLWTFNGVGTHLGLMVAATLFVPLYPLAPLLAWGFLAGPFNLFTLCLMAEESRLQRLLSSRASHPPGRLHDRQEPVAAASLNPDPGVNS